MWDGRGGGGEPPRILFVRKTLPGTGNSRRGSRSLPQSTYRCGHFRNPLGLLGIAYADDEFLTLTRASN